MKRLLAYLQLCRFGNVFSAAADIFLGFLLTHEALQPAGTFASLLISSAGLYLAGMVFNDVFDRKIDAIERPGRPIPSGRVPVKSAVIFGSLLMLIGIGGAAVTGLQSLLVAGLLVGAIFAYDGLLKSTVVGPVAMGACRFLNVMLGASAAFDGAWMHPWTAVWAAPQLYVALGLGLYIIGVTWYARQEATLSARPQLIGGLLVVNLGLSTLWWIATTEGAHKAGMLFIGFVIFTINFRAIRATLEPTPASVQMAVKIMLLSIISLDGILLLSFHQPVYAVIVICMLIPALLLSWLIPVT